MEAILVGLLLLLAGLGLTFAGLRVFMLLLPVFGFVTGFFLGASLIASWLGEGFLSTVVTWIVGIILGIIFALGSYLYWYVGAILAAASIGATGAMALVSIFGAESQWVYWIAAIVGGALMAFLALVVRLPVYMVLVSTAFGGATMVIGSLLLMFDQIELANLQWGTWHAINSSWLWWIAAVALAGVGIFTQWASIADTPLPEERWIRADARARRTSAVNNDLETRGY